MTLTVAIVGIHGWGREHLHNLTTAGEPGRAELVAVVDPLQPEHTLPPGVRWFASIDDLLATTVPDIVVIATPIHTHAELATQAMRAGAHVLLEKPTTATLAEFTALMDVAAETGKACQVGFQSLGSQALPEIARRITSGQIGELRGIGGVGTWVRSTDYYARADWAGRRRLQGREVVDGVVTNPLAHSVVTGLHIAGAKWLEHVDEVVTDLYRAHDIEADDTSAVRIHTAGGLTLAFGLTLAAPVEQPPRVIVYGSTGELELHYINDVLTARTSVETETVTFERTDLLDNLCDHLTDGTPLVAELADTGAFMQVLEAVRTAPDPTPIDRDHITWHHDEYGHRPVVADVAYWCEQVAIQGRTFSELGAPWVRSTTSQPVS